MATRGPYHGPAACRVSVASWNACDDESKWEGALTSWHDIARVPHQTAALFKWLDSLFRYGKGPIIWMDRPERMRAPLYLVSHHGKNIKGMLAGSNGDVVIVVVVRTSCIMLATNSTSAKLISMRFLCF